ncbi:glycosyltransferase [Dysgonomonas sp. 520]|uniref:glycosyltransferase n=1 Tax=Dysgonomonas sp. 520 TaxID=2302931 RepID=UPI0013CFA0FD|nr:glycosyltransferase [Dysgonomonas sp. 520]NDW10589.1 glycosyltransferase [Dysgonomonas sp. 520]
MVKEKTITIVACYFGPKLGVGVFMEKLLNVLLPILKENNYKVNLIANQNVLANSPSLVVDGINIITPKELDKSGSSKIYFLTKFAKTKFVTEAKYVFFLADSVIGSGIKNAISIVHDINEFDITNKFGRTRTWFRKQMIKRVIARSKKIIVISNFVLNQIHKYFPDTKTDSRLSVIHNGIDVKYAITENELQERQTEPYFMIVGRVDPLGKKLYEALKIYKTYKKFHPEIKLKIVGGMNDFCRKDGTDFINFATANDADVEYLGYVDEDKLNELYGNALATIFYSQFEGFGFPILEAFLRGCPVISNADNEVNDELAQGYDIKIKESDIENDEVICLKLKQLSEIPKLKLVSIATQFSWKNTAQKYFNVLND